MASITLSDEKPPGVERVEDIMAKTLTREDEIPLEEQKRIIRRIDLRLVTMTGLAYCISLMDRTNLSMAAIAGLTTELDLDRDNRYVGAPFLTSLQTHVSESRTDMLLVHRCVDVLRASRDIFQDAYTYCPAGILDGLGALDDVQKRFSIFYLIGCVASALSGILAFGLMQLNGKHGLSGWRWIFILEGVISGAIGILCYIFLVDFPDRASKSWRFLNEAECAFIVRRIDDDRKDGQPEPFSLKKFLKPALDLKIWAFAMIFFCLTTVTYAIAYFLPIILRSGMGFDIGQSQCLVAPPYVFAGIVMYTGAWIGDKYHVRGPVLIANALLAIIGLPMMGFAKGNATRYAGVFLTVAGANANIPSCMAYQANNVRGQWMRAFSSATLVGFGGLGGIASSLVFRDQDAPEYRPGMYAALACNILIILIVCALSVWFWFCNRQADRGKRVIEGEPSFRYTI
ncbi:hypothetical protein N7528_006869 [Penicillium herquei]|nr:hypothetical protein N7528_006869 [Penicillium herquei]